MERGCSTVMYLAGLALDLKDIKERASERATDNIQYSNTRDLVSLYTIVEVEARVGRRFLFWTFHAVL